MKKNLIFVFIAIGVLFALLQYQSKGAKKSPSESLNENILKMRESGEVSPDQEELVRLQLAIVDYIASKHTPPESLNLLVPKYFKSLPINPKTKKPFQYQKNGDTYVLLDAEGISSSKKEVAAGKPEASPTPEFMNPNTMAIEDFVYSPEGKRDPFKPFEVSPKVAIDENLPPLERYDLSQLKVSAVLSDSKGGMVAIVEDATGKGYTVKVGTKIGDKNGSVVSIDATQVNVLEKMTDFAGEIKQELRSIKLQKASEETKKPPKGRS